MNQQSLDDILRRLQHTGTPDEQLLVQEIIRLRGILTHLHNQARHDFSTAVEKAVDAMFKECSVHYNRTFKP